MGKNFKILKNCTFLKNAEFLEFDCLLNRVEKKMKIEWHSVNTISHNRVPRRCQMNREAVMALRRCRRGGGTMRGQQQHEEVGRAMP